MELWLDNRQSIEIEEVLADGFDQHITSRQSSMETDVYVVQDRLFRNERVIGSCITIFDESTQQKARSLVESVEWLVLEFQNWSMIPLENLIAACEGTPTKIAAVINEAEQANGAGFALEKGVDALIVVSDKRGQ